MLFRWFPWRVVIGRVARARGLLDPVKVLSRLESLGQPLEVKEPLELLRTGLIFHARGLLNTGVIQHNLDWIWPYWVMRQYNPRDSSFIPRAFSMTHINLTHRNWTAVGLPDCEALPIVDPAGLLTPFWDSWSLDAWVLGDDGEHLLPSRLVALDQELEWAPEVTVVTRSYNNRVRLETRVWVDRTDGEPACRMRVKARAEGAARLILSLRPYNPEGVSFIHKIQVEDRKWRLDDHRCVVFAERPAATFLSDYRRGDVYDRLRTRESEAPADARVADTSVAEDYVSEDCVSEDYVSEDCVSCHVGMATAAACFVLNPGISRSVDLAVPLSQEAKPRPAGGAPTRQSWSEVLDGSCQLSVPDPRIQFLFNAAVRSVVLHSTTEVVPGPYTYRRFWFRDAVFILHALLCMGFEDRTARHLAGFPKRQTRRGFFRSQDNEWDANGEVLWLFDRFAKLTGRAPDRSWRQAVRRGARWIARKRLPSDIDTSHAGLLPAGFSAEHLGPNDFYYWDDFWSVAGLRAAGELLEAWGDSGDAARYRREGTDLERAIERSLDQAAGRLGRPAMPAAPDRRLDPGAIGSIVAGYPLTLMEADDPRLLDTVRFLVDNCFVKGGFFQDLIHSGINPYLTLHVAQILLRVGDLRCLDLLRTVAALASPTGQWPEAIHPLTGGGCMGDGHHAWASAEWLMMIRNAFVRDEPDSLVLGSGILPEWLHPTGRNSDTPRGELRFGPTPTPWGPITVTVTARATSALVHWQGTWRGPVPRIAVRLPHHAPVWVEPGADRVEVRKLPETP